MAIRQVQLRKETNFWLNVLTEAVGVGRSKLPSGKLVNDVQRLEYVKQRLQIVGAKLIREQVERQRQAGRIAAVRLAAACSPLDQPDI